MLPKDLKPLHKPPPIINPFEVYKREQNRAMLGSKTIVYTPVRPGITLAMVIHALVPCTRTNELSLKSSSVQPKTVICLRVCGSHDIFANAQVLILSNYLMAYQSSNSVLDWQWSLPLCYPFLSDSRPSASLQEWQALSVLTPARATLANKIPSATRLCPNILSLASLAKKNQAL